MGECAPEEDDHPGHESTDDNPGHSMSSHWHPGRGGSIPRPPRLSLRRIAGGKRKRRRAIPKSDQPARSACSRRSVFPAPSPQSNSAECAPAGIRHDRIHGSALSLVRMDFPIGMTAQLQSRGPFGASAGISVTGVERPSRNRVESDRLEAVREIPSQPRTTAQTMALPIATKRNGRNHLSKNCFMGPTGLSTVETPCESLRKARGITPL